MRELDILMEGYLLKHYESASEADGLGRGLLEDVANLRQTLDSMSSRLGTSPEPPK